MGPKKAAAEGEAQGASKAKRSRKGTTAEELAAPFDIQPYVAGTETLSWDVLAIDKERRFGQVCYALPTPCCCLLSLSCNAICFVLRKQ